MVELQKAETPDFIPPALRPPNNLDLSPVDYTVWSVMQEKVYQRQIKDIGKLRVYCICIGQTSSLLVHCLKLYHGNYKVKVAQVFFEQIVCDKWLNLCIEIHLLAELYQLKPLSMNHHVEPKMATSYWALTGYISRWFTRLQMITLKVFFITSSNVRQSNTLRVELYYEMQ